MAPRRANALQFLPAPVLHQLDKNETARRTPFLDTSWSLLRRNFVGFRDILRTFELRGLRLEHSGGIQVRLE